MQVRVRAQTAAACSRALRNSTPPPFSCTLQEPNNVPVDFKTFVFEEGALRLTFSAANNTWALRFGSKAAHNAFHEQMFPQWTDTA